MAAARSPPASDPANSQFLRPKASGRIARSTGLLSIAKVPSSMKRVSASQRDSAYRIAPAMSLRPETRCSVAGAQVVQHRQRFLLAHLAAPVGRLAGDPLLDRIEFADASQRLLGERRLFGIGVDVVELPTHMGPTGCFGDHPLAVEPVEPGVAIGLKHTAEPCQMRARMLAAAIGAVAVEHCRGRGAAIRSLVA